ncbi:MAG: biotin--[acetyl-CoA-carboxylase] ligase [Oligoflexales bacterium]
MNISLSCFDSLSSTSTYVQKLLAGGCKPPFAVQADVQTKGLGQRGKTWTSPKGNLYLSLVIPNSSKELKSRELIPLKAAHLISNWLFREFGVFPIIKWPNDLFFAGKKLAGILCQTSVNSLKWGNLFIGIGLNVNHAPFISGTAYQSISLSQIKPSNREVRLLAQSLVDFWSNEWFAVSEEEVLEHYERFSLAPFSLWKEKVCGKALYHRELGVDTRGNLCLQELAIESAKSSKQHKLNSASHSLNNVFLSRINSPFLVACQLQETLYFALFADRFQTHPYSLQRLALDQISEGLNAVLQELRKDFDASFDSGGTAWPVSCLGSAFNEREEVVKNFESYRFLPLEPVARPRLSKGFEDCVDNSAKIRLAAVESYLERKRPHAQGANNRVIVDWSKMLGCADFLSEQGMLIRTINSQEVAQLVSEARKHQACHIEYVDEDQTLNLVLHGLMLLAIG